MEGTMFAVRVGKWFRSGSSPHSPDRLRVGLERSVSRANLSADD